MARALKTHSARTAQVIDDDGPGSVRPTLAVDDAFAPSPARRLQQDLQLAYASQAEQRWSGRRTLGFIVLTNGLFWIGLVAGIRALV